MKILYIQDSLGTGGAERSNAELWYDLKSRGNVDLKIVVLEHRAEGIEEEILNNGFNVFFLRPGNFLSHVTQIKKIIKEFTPDIVHSVLFRSAIRVRMARLNKKFYHLEHLVNCSYSPIRFKDPKINKTGLTFFKYINRYTQGRGTDKFIAITEEVKTHAIEYLKIPPHKIEVIPRGRTENPFIKEKGLMKAKILSELKITGPAVLFIHVGRQEYQKGHIDFLKAIKKINKNIEEFNGYFIFCGRKGNATGEINRFLNDNMISERLHWLGHRHDISKLLAGSDVFVFPSLFEGLGGSLIEAQAAGLPIICSDIPVFNEVVKNKKNAFMFKVTDSDDLAKHLIEVGRNKELQLVMGRESLKNFHEKFLIENIHNRIYALYKNLIQ